jgi:hypothetical protein
MSLSPNDLQTRAWVKYNLTATTGNDLTSGASCRIMAISLTPAATALATLVVANAATVTGTDLIHLQSAVSGNTSFVFFGSGGVRFGTGVSYTLVGTGNLGEIYVVLDT